MVSKRQPGLRLSDLRLPGLLDSRAVAFDRERGSDRQHRWRMNDVRLNPSACRTNGWSDAQEILGFDPGP